MSQKKVRSRTPKGGVLGKTIPKDDPKGALIIDNQAKFLHSLKSQV